MRPPRFLFIIPALFLAILQLQAQALYRPKPKQADPVPYYSCIRASGAQIISDDPVLLTSWDAREIIKALYPREFRTSRVQNVIGSSLFILGLPTSIAGLLFYVAALAVPKDEYGPFSFTKGFGGAGTYCTVGGLMGIGGGIVLLSNGRKTVERIVENYHSTHGAGHSFNLSFSPTRNGVGLVLRF